MKSFFLLSNIFLYPEWVHNLLEGGDIHIQIEDEEDNKLAKKTSLYGTLVHPMAVWHPVNRPSMKIVVQIWKERETN